MSTPHSELPTQQFPHPHENDRTQLYIPAPQPAPAAGSSCLGRLARLMLVGWLMICAFWFGAMVFAGLWFGGNWVSEERLLPGVHVLGINIGNLTQTEAVEVLNTAWRTRAIKLDAPQLNASTTPDQLGFVLNAEQTVTNAYQWGHTTSIMETITFLSQGAEVHPIWWFDPGRAEATLQELAPQLQVAPLNAGVQFANGRLLATPAVPGQALDVPLTVQWLQENGPELILSNRLPLVMTTLQPAVASTETLVEQANQQLLSHLALPLFDPVNNERLNWEIPVETWTTWLTAQTLAGDNGLELEWQVAGEKVIPFIQAQRASLGSGRYVNEDEAVRVLHSLVNAQLNGRSLTLNSLRVYHSEQTHVVAAGETISSIARQYGLPYPWLQQANPQVSTLSVGQELTIPSPDEFLPLPVVENKRAVISISEQKMWIYENEAVKWEWVISTGISSSPTSPGVYQVQSHQENAYAGNWDLWMPYFMGIYRPVPTSDFMNGFHGFPTRNGNNLLWTNSLGTPVTYGCILVSNDNAALLYEWAEEGVVVEIRP